MMVLFGKSSGPVLPWDPNILNAKGSLYFTRPGIGHYTATREELLWRACDIFSWISDSSLKVRVDCVYPLKEVADTHRALETRQTNGKVLLQTQKPSRPGRLCPPGLDDLKPHNLLQREDNVHGCLHGHRLAI
jgi:hypothetical protein